MTQKPAHADFKPQRIFTGFNSAVLAHKQVSDFVNSPEPEDDKIRGNSRKEKMNDDGKQRSLFTETQSEIG